LAHRSPAAGGKGNPGGDILGEDFLGERLSAHIGLDGGGVSTLGLGKAQEAALAAMTRPNGEAPLIAAAGEIEQDQWMLNRFEREQPVYRFTFADAEGTVLYVCVCVVADRGMIGAETIAGLARRLLYILVCANALISWCANWYSTIRRRSCRS
jgi:hypothetical protein